MVEDSPDTSIPDLESDSTDTFTLPSHFDIQGHRGARGLKPENTLLAFETALDLEVPTLELDLHWAADDVLVVWHDPSLDPARCRLEPAASTPLPPDPDDSAITEAELALRALSVDQLKKYRCDRNPDASKYPDQSNDPTAIAGDASNIITLAELFDFVDAYAAQDSGKSETQRQNAQSVQFNIETKRDPNAPETIGDGFDGTNAGPFELALLSLIESRGLADRVIIQSFDHRSLRAVRTQNANLRLAALTQFSSVTMDALAADGFSIWSPIVLEITASSVGKAHDQGLWVIPYTINDASEMHRLLRLGVDGIITDRPDVLLDVVRSYR